jgi:chromosomal replication initiation ATPase DnaA
MPNLNLTEYLLLQAAQHFAHESALITSRSQSRELVDIRKIVAYIARSCGRTWTEVGRSLNRGHSTIATGYQVTESLIRHNKAFRLKMRAFLVALDEEIDLENKVNSFS